MQGVMQEIRQGLGGKLRAVEEKSGGQSFVTVAPEDVYDVADHFYTKLGGRLATASGVDTPETIEILYHFCFDSRGAVVTVKTAVPKPNPTMRSLAPLMPAANWIEREMQDLLGVRFEGHPDPRRLILADDWPPGVYPLRHDQDGKERQG